MKLLLADGHHLLRESLVAFLSWKGGDIACEQAATLKETRDILAAEADFDLVLLDYHMPGMNGLAGLGEVKGLAAGAAVGILAGELDDATAVRLLEAGAAGVIRRDCRINAFLGAIRLMATGETYVPVSLLGARRARQLDDDGARGARGAFAELTPRELACVKLLAQGKTNREIGTALGIAEGTVKLHFNSAFKKMGARHRSDALLIALRNGIEVG